MKTRMTCKPGAHGRRLLSVLLFHQQMHVQLRRDVHFDRKHEIQEPWACDGADTIGR